MNNKKFKIIKALLFLVMGTAVIFTLSGCSALNEALSEKMLKKSGVLENGDYLEYQSFVSGSKLDENGRYRSNEDTDATTSGNIHVTFAENVNLKIGYYFDKEHKAALDTADCYLNPGDLVYAEVPEEYDGSFEFGSFMIYEYDKNGKRSLSSALEMTKSGDGYVLSIPDDYSGTDISVEPWGVYHKKVPKVTVVLPQPKFGGSIAYYLGGREIKTPSVSAEIGSVISVKFNYWNGWKSESIIDTTEYTVGETGGKFDFGGKSVDDFFSEDEAHKPVLKVILEKSVGKDLKIAVNAVGCSEETDYGNWKPTAIVAGKDREIVKQKIGTAEPIDIKISNRAILSGMALRMTITRTENNGASESEVRYITDIANGIGPVYVYEPEKIADSKVTYSSIEIKIGVDEIEKYSEPAPSKDTFLIVKNAVTGKKLNKGDIVSTEQEVIVTISPKTGYCLNGKDVSDNVYNKTMKYSDFKKSINGIVAEHTAEKYLNIILGETSNFAKYTYKLDGKQVSGTVKAKEGQKLELTFEITDPKYSFKEAKGGIFGLGASYTKVTEKIVLSTDMDGKKVTESDFGIEIVKGD